MNKLMRTNFLNIENVYGIQEYDLLMNYWDMFQTKRSVGFFTITKNHIQRPDLISLQIYNSINYWWILSKYNKIDDWWNDIYVGQVINVPSIMDIEDFYTLVKNMKK